MWRDYFVHFYMCIVFELSCSFFLTLICVYSVHVSLDTSAVDINLCLSRIPPMTDRHCTFKIYWKIALKNFLNQKTFYSLESAIAFGEGSCLTVFLQLLCFPFLEVKSFYVASIKTSSSCLEYFIVECFTWCIAKRCAALSTFCCKDLKGK